MPREDFEHSGAVAEETRSKERLERPPMYKVLLHNDDFTSMEFVVFVLKTVFGKNDNDAVQIMLNVHNQGIGIAGLYTLEIAEMKVMRVTDLAQSNDFPLLCTIEEVPAEAS